MSTLDEIRAGLREPEPTLHITLRRPLTIKFGDEIVPIMSFDGTITGFDPTFVTFETNRVWKYELAHKVICGVAFKNTLIVPAVNIAGIVQQPFVGR